MLFRSDDPLVEFYDAEQSVKKFGPMGQFVTRYYASTLLEKPFAALALDLGIPEWTVNAEEAKVVSAWLRLTVPGRWRRRRRTGCRDTCRSGTA